MEQDDHGDLVAVTWAQQHLCIYDKVFINNYLTLSHIQQICSRRLWKHVEKTIKKYLYTRVYLLKKVENFVAKGEIAHFEQFLQLSQCFQNSSAAEASERHQKASMCGKGLRSNLFYIFAST